MYKKQLWKKALTLLTAVGCATAVATTASADIGTEKWQKTFNTSYVSFYFGGFAAVDFLDTGTILASGHGDGGLAVRYNADTGTILDSPPEWIRYDTGSDYFYDQVIDSNGDIYFAGRHDLFDPGVWKYNSSAVLQTGWPKVYAETGDGLNNGVALDSLGFVYSVGYNNSNWHISKHNTSDGSVPTGFPLSYDPNGFLDKASKVATDSDNNFIVVGWVGVSASSYDWHIRKYASDGSLLWETSYDLKGNTEAAIDVGVDSEDNIIVCGYRNNGTDESTGMDRDWYIVKYAKDGDGTGGATVLWEQAWNGGNGATSRVARTLLIDSSDNVYVAGDQRDSSGADRPFLQYRDGRTGALLKLQELSHPLTVRGAAGTTTDPEHDYITDLALQGDQLIIAGYVWEKYVNYGRTGFITMLDIQKTYNVTTAVDTDCTDGQCDLQSALDAAASNNGVNMELRLQQGFHTGNFTYEPASGNNGDLTILGGYSADFSTRTLDPTNTILDGGNADPVLQLNPGITDGPGTTTVNGSLTVEGLTITNGVSYSAGGLLALTNPPGMIEIRNNIIENNHADEGGGGCAVAVTDFATLTGGDIYFADNIVRNNSVLLTGETDGYAAGGCAFMVSGETLLSNNLVYGNSVNDTTTYDTPTGGGLDFQLMAGELTLTNNTIVDNEILAAGTASGGGISLRTDVSSAWGLTTVELNNSIIYNNTVSTGDGNDIFNQVISTSGGATDGSTLAISYSNYGGYYQSLAPAVDPTLTGNINADPLLSSITDSLYYLISGSPSIDSGDNNVLDMPATDLAGETRPQDGDGDGTATANMGCYEEIVYSITGNTGKSSSLDPSTPSPQIVYVGDTVTFTFNSDANYHISTVSGCGVDFTNTDNDIGSYTATTDPVTGNCEVTAYSAINQYQVTAAAGSDGELDASTPTPQAVDHGSTTQFIFNVVTTGYHVATVSGCGIDFTNTDNDIGSYTATIDPATADCAVNATFAVNQYQVTAAAGTNGALDASTPTPQTIDYDSTTQFIFNAEPGYHVAIVTGCGVDYQNQSDNSISTYTATTDPVTAGCAVNATFDLNLWDVVSSVSGGNGTINPSGTQTVANGHAPSFDLTPSTGYHIDQITGTCGGILSGSTFTANPVTADCTVIASFTDQYTLSLVFAGKGSGTVTSTTTAGSNDCTTDCSADYLDGTDVTLTAVADDKNSFLGWSGDTGGACTGTDPCTITMDQAREITTTFNSGFPWTMFLPAITGGNQ